MPVLREPILSGGCWIHRIDYSPTAMAIQGEVRRVFQMNNKENISCGWGRSPAVRIKRSGRSPLPDWYPRSPLRDITSIVKAYERSRLRFQAAEQTAAISSSAGPQLQITNPQPLESSTPSNSSMNLPMKPCPLTTGHADDDGQTPVIESSTLLKSIEQIEKAVKRNMITMKKKQPESKRATQLRNLRSMR